MKGIEQANEIIGKIIEGYRIIKFLGSGKSELPLGGKKYDAGSTQLRNDNRGYSGVRV